MQISLPSNLRHENFFVKTSQGPDLYFQPQG